MVWFVACPQPPDRIGVFVAVIVAVLSGTWLIGRTWGRPDRKTIGRRIGRRVLVPQTMGTIQFQSDVDATALESATLLLVVTGRARPHGGIEISRRGYAERQ